MIIIDKALERLERENKPIRVGIIGAGFMGRAVANQIINHTKGMRLVAVSNRRTDSIETLYREVGAPGYEMISDQESFDEAVLNGKYVGTLDPDLLCRSKGIDVIVEVTGTIEFAAGVALEAFENKKHLIWMNAELDGTLGPILKVYADKAGVIATNSDGDQPGVLMNLFRFVAGMGVKPVLCGNLKGLEDHYRTPATQIEFGKKWDQKPETLSAYADGTKMSFEQVVVANAADMRVSKRGMSGIRVPPNTNLNEAVKLLPTDEIIKSDMGLVDYLIGTEYPSPGVFILGTVEDPKQKKLLNLYKLGEGPLYCFSTPQHLCHMEVPNSIARVALFSDTITSPVGAPKVEVISIAKKDLKAGEKLDGIGKFMLYGVCENSDVARTQNLFPIGLAEGAILKRDIAKDAALTFDDVDLPTGRLCDRIWREQVEYFKNSN